MSRFVTPIILVSLAILIQPVFAQQILPSFTAHYSLSKGPIEFGKTIRSIVRVDDKHFLFKSVTIPKGIATIFTEGEVTEQSTWIVHEQSIRPIEYSYINTASKQKRDVKLLFNWQTQTITNIINGDPWKMDLTTGTLDKLVYQLSVMLDLAKQQKDLEYLVADGGKLKTYSIKIRGEEIIEIPLGNFKTTKVVRTGKNSTTILWCAQELKYLPIKIEQIKDTGNVVATLYELEGIKIPEPAKSKTNTPKTQDSTENTD